MGTPEGKATPANGLVARARLSSAPACLSQQGGGLGVRQGLGSRGPVPLTCRRAPCPASPTPPSQHWGCGPGASPGQVSGPWPHCLLPPGSARGTAGRWPTGQRKRPGSPPLGPPCRSLWSRTPALSHSWPRGHTLVREPSGLTSRLRAQGPPARLACPGRPTLWTASEPGQAQGRGPAPSGGRTGGQGSCTAGERREHRNSAFATGQGCKRCEGRSSGTAGGGGCPKAEALAVGRTQGH